MNDGAVSTPAARPLATERRDTRPFDSLLSADVGVVMCDSCQEIGVLFDYSEQRLPRGARSVASSARVNVIHRFEVMQAEVDLLWRVTKQTILFITDHAP
jgi:hypothetical protein